MVLKCPVLLNNDAVTVIKFNDVEVQIPAIERQASIVTVRFDNGKYSVVDDNYSEESNVVDTPVYKTSKKIKKTTTVENTVSDIETASVNE